eukprot:4355172-Prymnesium_polylepis.2
MQSFAIGERSNQSSGRRPERADQETPAIAEGRNGVSAMQNYRALRTVGKCMCMCMHAASLYLRYGPKQASGTASSIPKLLGYSRTSTHRV